MAIEKFKGTFGKEDGGCTIIVNQTINSIRDGNALALYIYLSCRPDDWDLNVKHLQEHFIWGRDKTYGALSKLQELFLLKKIEHREKGVFVEHEYILMLRPFSPLPENKELVESRSSIESSPLPCLPDVVPTGSGFISTHNKQRYIQNKEELKNKEIPPLSPKGGMCGFEDFWNAYPCKKARKKCEEIWKRRKLDSIADEIIDGVNRLKKDDDHWLRGYVPNPTTFLNQDRWNDEASESQASIREKEMLQKKLDAEKRRCEQERLTQLEAEAARNKFTQANRDGKAYRDVVKRVAKECPSGLATLKASLRMK